MAAALVAAFFTFPVTATEIWVVTDRQHPVQGTSDRLIELDAPARIEADLSAGLSADPHRAVEIARQRLRDNKRQQQLHAAYQSVADARSLNIVRIPAVVVDRRYVVYGEANVARAVACVEVYRSARP
jgi:integrating conjugative element protein (TIGR03757 family)